VCVVFDCFKLSRYYPKDSQLSYECRPYCLRVSNSNSRCLQRFARYCFTFYKTDFIVASVAGVASHKLTRPPYCFCCWYEIKSKKKKGFYTKATERCPVGCGGHLSIFPIVPTVVFPSISTKRLSLAKVNITDINVNRTAKRLDGEV
jgi:hypothetical protein